MSGEKIKTFQDLIVWQKAHQLAMEIYKVTKRFHADERFGMISQMRRAATSIPANICEGFDRRSVKGKVNFYFIAQGSLSELKYFIIASRDLGYHKEYESLWKLAMDVSRLIAASIKSLEGSR